MKYRHKGATVEQDGPKDQVRSAHDLAIHADVRQEQRARVRTESLPGQRVAPELCE